MKQMIEAGAAGVHFEDQLSSAKKCGHMGGKVLVPTQEAINKLVAARLAADVCDVPTVLVARTDAESQISSRRMWMSGTGRSSLQGAHGRRLLLRQGGIEIGHRARLAYAPYSDLIWCETGVPIWKRRSTSPRASTRNFPASCSRTIVAVLQLEEEALGCRDRQIPTRARRHGLQVPVRHARRLPPLNYSMFQLARGYKASQMSAYVQLQQRSLQRRASVIPHEASARSGRGLLRRRDSSHHGRHIVHHRAQRLAEEAQFAASKK